MRRIFYNSHLANMLLLPGYGTAMFFGYIITKHTDTLPESTQRHESIHAEQYAEVTLIAYIIALLLQIMFGGGWWFVPVPFAYYLIYFLEAAFTWFVRVVSGRASDALDMAYANSMFEQEARAGENAPGYIESRKLFAFLRYFGKI